MPWEADPVTSLPRRRLPAFLKKGRSAHYGKEKQVRGIEATERKGLRREYALRPREKAGIVAHPLSEERGDKGHVLIWKRRT